MINELNVIDSLRETILKNLNGYLPEDFSGLTEKQVIIDFPSVDQMPAGTMIYLQPNYADYEALATTNDRTIFNVSVFLLCKRDQKRNLTLKMYGYFNALFECIRRNQDLGGVVDFSHIDNVEFYPAVEANRNVMGAELSVACEYTKDFD